METFFFWTYNGKQNLTNSYFAVIVLWCDLCQPCRFILMPQPNMATTFGQYIDTLIRLYASLYKKNLTEFIKNDLSNDKNDAPNRLSSRQIARMRDIGADEFPEGKGLLKLLEALPSELQTLNPADLCSRLLTPWEAVQSFQAEVIEQYDRDTLTLTIVSGRKPPLALSSSEVVAAMTIAIQKGAKYTFLYPAKETYGQDSTQDPETMTQSWCNVVKRRIVRYWEEQQEREAIEKGLTTEYTIDSQALVSTEGLQRFEQKVQASVRVVHSSLDTDFWFLLPSNYLVLYNIEPEYESRDLPRYGVFRVQGNSVIRASTQQMDKAGYPSTTSEGWLRMLDTTYESIAEAYKTAVPKSDDSESSVDSMKEIQKKQSKSE
jgi:hypothetical protein